MNWLMMLAFGGAGGCFMGLAIAKRSKEREKYFGGLVELCARLSSYISFRADKTEDILRGAEINSAALKRNVSAYLDYIGGGELKIECDFIGKAEREEVKDFFMSLGKFDAETQLSDIRRRQDGFERKFAAVSHKNERQSGMYVKLGFFGGLLAAILLI